MTEITSDPLESPRRPGTIGAVGGTPARVPGSVRRTSTLDILFAATGPDGGPTIELRGRGRDLSTTSAGAAAVTAEASTRVLVDQAKGLVLAIDVSPARWQPAVAALVGAPGRNSFRRAAATALPEVMTSGSLLGLLLDDVPVALIIAGASLGRQGLMAAPASAELRADAPSRHPSLNVCAGWAEDGEMVMRIRRGERASWGDDPRAGDLTLVGESADAAGDHGDDAPDPLAWHPVDDLPVHAMRRRRRLDLRPARTPGSPLTFDVLFRDTYVQPGGEETVVHEYGIVGSIRPGPDPAILTLTTTAHVLPGPDCPNAVASAQRVVGLPLSEVRSRVSQTFSGASTCTHLNDALRSIGDLSSLVASVERA